jgi:hypothetical protein
MPSRRSSMSALLAPWELVSVLRADTATQVRLLGRVAIEGAFLAVFRRRTPGRDCPECLERIWSDATRCSYCGADLIEEDDGGPDS